MHLTLPDLDDCWKRIGIHGDQSCPHLAEHIHCRNCPTYAAAATLLLDRPDTPGVGLPAASAAPPVPPPSAASESVLIFRIGDEWLGLPATCVREVLEPRPVHVLPHRRQRLMQGLVNVRGVLTVCVSLAEMLGIGPATRTYPGALARLVVAGEPGRANALPVDAVYGIARFAPGDLVPRPGTVARATATYTRAVARWNDHNVGLLDAGLLFYSMDRGLT